MTKYSEAKKIIKVLHHYGWEKHIGFSSYRKIWYAGNLRYGQSLSAELLFAAPLEFIIGMLEYQDEMAAKEIAKKYI